MHAAGICSAPWQQNWRAPMSEIHLVHMFFHSPITHTALSWASEEDGQLAGMGDYAYWQDIARTLERGRFDAAFFADTPAASDQYKGGALSLIHI